eukprot:COSAG05_NODE_21481_length_271_cov_1.093023_1_plen_24_part_01
MSEQKKKHGQNRMERLVREERDAG